MAEFSKSAWIQIDPRLAEYLMPLDHLLTRTLSPRRQVKIEQINGRIAATSDYAEALQRIFEVRRDHHHLSLFRRTR